MEVKDMARMGGKARAKKLSKAELTKIGKKGAATRWAKSKSTKIDNVNLDPRGVAKSTKPKGGK